MKYKRHMLMEISLGGRERLFNSLCTEKKDNPYYTSLLLPNEFSDSERYLSKPYYSSIPAIVRRKDEYTPTNSIAVGFSSWQRNNQGRIKVAGYVNEDEILSLITPYEVAQILLKHHECYDNNHVIDALTDLIEKLKNEVMIGIWGSVALEIVTGYRYIHKSSDLDIILSFIDTTETNIDKLHFVLNTLNVIETKYDLRIDPEVELSNGYGVSLKELCTNSKTLLGKSINDISLLPRELIYLDLNI